MHWPPTWEAARLNVGESDLSRMTFPAMSLDDAIGTFTEIVYGKPPDIRARLTPYHVVFVSLRSRFLRSAFLL